MPIAKCPRCGTLFDKAKKVVCATCEPEERAEYDKVLAYIQGNPDHTIEEIVDTTGVKREVVERMTDQGVVMKTANVGEVKCGRCGAPAISLTKRLCENCLAELQRNIAKETSSIKLPQKKNVQIFSHVADAIEAKRQMTRNLPGSKKDRNG